MYKGMRMLLLSVFLVFAILFVGTNVYAADSPAMGKECRVDKKEIGSVQTIKVDMEHFDFLMEESDDDKFYLSYDYTTKGKRNPLEYQVKDNVLSLKEQNGENATYYAIAFGPIVLGNRKYADYKNVVTLYVPKDYRFTDVDIELQEGELGVSKLCSKQISVSLQDGDAHFDSIDIGKGSVGAVDGDLYLGNICVSSELQIESDSGDIDALLSDGDLVNLELMTEEGEIIVDDRYGTVSDNCEGQYYQAYLTKETGKLVVKSDFGDISIRKE